MIRVIIEPDSKTDFDIKSTHVTGSDSITVVIRFGLT